MNKTKTLIVKAVSALSAISVLSGCASTKTTIYEYDSSGNVIKKTETGESVIKSITESTKEKTVFAYDNSFVAYISASTATTEDPTPTFRMGVGKADKGVLSLHKSHSIETAPELIKSARAGEISFGASGITSSGTSKQEKTDTK